MAAEHGASGGTNGFPRYRTRPRYNPWANLDTRQVRVVKDNDHRPSAKPSGVRPKPKQQRKRSK